jgi:hypothetical protein
MVAHEGLKKEMHKSCKIYLFHQHSLPDLTNLWQHAIIILKQLHGPTLTPWLFMI